MIIQHDPFVPGENFIFLSVNDDIHVAIADWEHSDLAEIISLDPNLGHHTYGMGAGYANARTGNVNFYGYTDGMRGEGPEGKKERFLQEFLDAGLLPNGAQIYHESNGTRLGAAKNWNQLQYQRWQNQQYPNEQHGLPGDCINPKCDYMFTVDDIREIEDNSGWFTCPNCGWTYNYLDESEKKYTRAGLTLDQMGKIGENIIEEMGEVPNVGTVTRVFGMKQNPIDAIVGQYGVEIKTNHSEAQARFKIGGENIYLADLGRAVRPKEAKEYYCQQNGLIPAIIGVRLNFYTDKADIFFREGMTDTWIGNAKLLHVATVDFTNLNPFKDPQDVPPASELPDDDSTPPDDIPF